MLSYEKRHLSILSGPRQRTTAGDNTLGVVRNIAFDESNPGTVGAALTVLHTFTLPANSLIKNGDGLRIVYGGLYASNANTKRIQTEFDSQVLYNSGLLTINSGSWQITEDILRLSATSIRVSLGVLLGQIDANAGSTAVAAGGGAEIAGRNITVTVANLNSNPVVIRVLGQGTANDDVQQTYSTIDIVQN